MIIQFKHNGQSLDADLIYDFTQFKDTILLKHLSTNKAVNEDILFFKEGKKWKSNSDMQDKFPVTYQSILAEIRSSFHI